jgi:CRP-like cAMP-binding protein
MENLARCATPESFEQGSAIVDHERLHVIDDGAVECASEDGFTGRLGPGSCFGESVILGNHRQRSTITAVAPVTTWAITRADFLGSLGAPARTSDEPAPGAPRDRDAAPAIR